MIRATSASVVSEASLYSMAKAASELVLDLARGQRITLKADGRVDGSDTPAAHALALVPADRCSVIAVELPDVPSRRLHEALRWAIEDQIAGDPEQQHVVPLGRNDAGQMRCLVAGRDDMQRWCQSLPAGVPAAMVPDAACLPLIDGAVVLLAVGDHVLARWGEQRFDRFERDLLDEFVPEALRECGESPRVIAYGTGLPRSVAGVAVEQGPLEGNVLAWLAQQSRQPDALVCDLLRGEFAVDGGTQPDVQWKPLTLAAGFLLVLLFGQLVVERWVLSAERDRVSTAVSERQQQLFPEITQWVRPQAQAQRRLEELRGHGGSNLLQLLGTVAPVLGGVDGLQLEALEYDDDGGLVLALDAPALADIEALQRQIEARSAETALRDVAIRDGRTRARLRVTAVSGS